MKLIQQILAERGGDIDRSFTIILGFGGYFKGVKRVEEFSEQSIVLTAYGKKLSVRGEKLSIGEYFQGDIFISGEIKVVEVE